MVNLKRFGGWKSDSVAEGYIADSKENKRKLADRIQGESEKKYKIDKENALPNLSISNCHNCSFQFVVNNGKPC